jgi:hypothetical protein
MNAKAGRIAAINCLSCQSHFDDLTALHHEANSLQLAYVDNRICGDGHEISKFPGINGAHAILPTNISAALVRISKSLFRS